MAAGGERKLLRQEINKTILTMTYLHLIFVFGVIQPLFCTSPMAPTIGEAIPEVVARLRPRNINVRCYDWLQHQLEENPRLCSASKLVPERQQHTTNGVTALTLTL